MTEPKLIAPLRVKDMIRMLRQLDPEDVLILASDSEGNSFSYSTNIIEKGHYKDLGYNDVEVGSTELTDQMREWGMDESDLLPPDSPKCVVLYPAL